MSKSQECDDNSIVSEDIDDMFSEEFLNLEDHLSRKKKIRLTSKYSEKRYIP